METLNPVGIRAPGCHATRDQSDKVTLTVTARKRTCSGDGHGRSSSRARCTRSSPPQHAVGPVQAMCVRADRRRVDVLPGSPVAGQSAHSADAPTRVEGRHGRAKPGQGFAIRTRRRVGRRSAIASRPSAAAAVEEVVRVRVLVTGGTGFVGSHTVAALVAAGHDIRLLVRSPHRIAPALRPLGVSEPVDHVVGDVTDRDCVDRALDGCDAVVHAAAVYSLDSRAYGEIARTNLRGAETVLAAAVRRGCDPVVHVSSTVALLQRRATVSADSPLSTARGVYVRSKAASEAVARRLQDDGAPIVIVHPGSVLGPHDPHLCDGVRRLRNILRGQYPTWPSGGYHQVDVRDVARLHAAVMSPGAGPRRYIVPGHHVDGRAVFDVVQTVTGRRLRARHRARPSDASVRLDGQRRPAGAAGPSARRVRGRSDAHVRHPVRRLACPRDVGNPAARAGGDVSGHRAVALTTPAG